MNISKINDNIVEMLDRLQIRCVPCSVGIKIHLLD